VSAADPLATTRDELQRVATHILARARFEADGRIGLQVTPGGIGTPPFGPEQTTVRIDGGVLVREVRATPRSAALAMAGRSLADLAAFAGVDLGGPRAAGADAPALGDVDAPVALDPGAVAEIASWYRLGAEAIDRILPEAAEPTLAQLWPEHFDLGIDVAAGPSRVNLGVSPGDAHLPEPYLYLGPWDDRRPGDPAFWNAPFGAALGRSTVMGAPDPVERAAAFFRQGIALLG
jgi:hypothetical protein